MQNSYSLINYSNVLFKLITLLIYDQSQLKLNVLNVRNNINNNNLVSELKKMIDTYTANVDKTVKSKEKINQLANYIRDEDDDIDDEQQENESQNDEMKQDEDNDEKNEIDAMAMIVNKQHTKQMMDLNAEYVCKVFKKGMKLMHDIIRNLIFVTHAWSNSTSKDVSVIRFLVILCTRNANEFISDTRVSPLVARLKRLARLCGLHHVKETFGPDASMPK